MANPQIKKARVFGARYAPVYDYLYKDKDYEKECDFIEKVFRKYSLKPKTILDLGCGTGNHAFILAKRDYEVIGIDRSAEMLRIARKKAKEKKIQIDFMQEDITKLRLKRKFDAVISMFAVMGYQVNNQALSGVCRSVKQRLSKGGIFLFDCWHGNAVINQKPSVRKKEVKLDNHRKIVRFTQPVLDILNHTVETRFKLCEMRGDHLVNQTLESHFMRFLFPQEIKYFLEVAGFKHVDFCPFLKLNKPLTEQDWNMAVIAKA